MMKPFTAWIQVDKRTGEGLPYINIALNRDTEMIFLYFLDKKEAQTNLEFQRKDKQFEVIQVEIKQMLYDKS